jgi:D-arabinose 1-dehydrogenase-like Zn-dependent alcohol dehydrogenase
MWTSTVELSPRRVLLTRFLGQFWRGAYFSSFAPLQVQNLPRQSLPAHNWIRVRNRLAGICGSDLKLIYADGDFRIAPAALPSHTRIYPGHEVVGEVIEVGEDVRQVKVGDRVVLQYGQNCVSQGLQPPCRWCAAGQYSLCEQGALSGLGQIGGGWSEEMLVHESQVFRVPDELSDEQAVLIEPSAVALHAVLHHLPRPGEQVLIVGAGSIGLLVLQVVRALAPEARVSVLAGMAGAALPDLDKPSKVFFGRSPFPRAWDWVHKHIQHEEPHLLKYEMTAAAVFTVAAVGLLRGRRKR